MRTTIRDVARRAGISAGMVSRILNPGATPANVRDETRSRVMRTAQRLGYRPNPISSALRTRHTATIGVVAESIARTAGYIEAAERLCAKRGYEVVLSVVPWCEPELEDTALQRLLHRRVDGILVLSPAIRKSPGRFLRPAVRDGLPMVLVGPSRITMVDTVDIDREDGFRQLTAHLLDRGCRKFLFVPWWDTPGVRQRLAGVHAALRKKPGVRLETVRHSNSGRQMSRNELELELARRFKSHPDAVLSSTEDIAMVAMRVAEDMKIRVPADMAVVGGHEQPYSEYLRPPLTTLRWDEGQVMRLAVNRLIERIENTSGRFSPMRLKVPPEMVVRQSSMFKTSL